jgi:hypothetical protein
VAANPHALGRFAAGPLHGAGLALYFLLLPYVVVTKWDQSAHQSHGSFVRFLLVVLSIFWLAFLVQVVHNIVQLRRGRALRRDGCAWLAGMVLVMLPFLSATSTGAPAGPSSAMSTPYSATTRDVRGTLDERGHARDSPARRPDRGAPSPMAALGAMPMALVAKRRRDDLRLNQFSPDESQVDESIRLLRGASPRLIAELRQVIGDDLDGVVTFAEDPARPNVTPSDRPVVVCVLESNSDGTVISFAHEGGRLRVPAGWNADHVAAGVVGLHDGGRLTMAGDETTLLRALATRALRHTLVLFLDGEGVLDDELRACAVTIETVDAEGPQRHGLVAGQEPSPVLSTRPFGDVRVEVLRSDPRVVGLAEPFLSTLRRRCIEMTTYLALHRLEPVTGDRLRVRVLANGDVDASSRTLANTASAVRRSLGADGDGARLHPVGPSGLYATHALTSDLEVFHALVARARQLNPEDGAPLVHEALSLVRGEPLAAALRGFEWFLAEGHAGRLARDGEWAALALHHDALSRGDVERAYWALEQGRLIDPYSDALVEALAAVPRLREFGGNGSGAAKHETVGAGAGKVIGRPLDGLRHQIA